MTNERMKALGEYEMLKKELFEIGITAGSHIESVRDELGLRKDFLEVNFFRVKTLVEQLEKAQKKAKELERKISELEETYGFSK